MVSSPAQHRSAGGGRRSASTRSRSRRRRGGRYLAVSATVVLLGAMGSGAFAALVHDDPAQPSLPSISLSLAPEQAELLPADRDLLVRVRLAGLWEMPAGRMAVAKGTGPRVREVGRMMAEQHVELDKLVVAAANSLHVSLPDQPSAEQQSWLREMSVAKGAAFDRVYVNRLRAAHGKIFPAIAGVRSGTRNATVRQLAAQANNFVLMHLTYLDSTGLVDYATIPVPPDPAPAPDRFYQAGDITSEGAVGALLFTALVVLASVALRVARPGFTRRPPGRWLPQGSPGSVPAPRRTTRPQPPVQLAWSSPGPVGSSASRG